MFAPGTKVRCTKHNGAHTGTVMVVIGRSGYGIGWRGFVSVPQTAEERALMKELSADGTTFTAADDVTEEKS